jgi:hypothetical protein
MYDGKLSAHGELVAHTTTVKYGKQVITSVLYHDVDDKGDIFHVVQSTVIPAAMENNRVELRHSYRMDDDGTVRWDSNGRVIPKDCIKDAMCMYLPEFSALATDANRESETAKMVADYAAWREKTPYSAEEMFEMRAAFGEGAEVVNVLTGKGMVL